MKVFLSYPSAMHSVVENIYHHLPDGAFETWLDTKRITAGAAIREEIVQHIRDSEYFVSFLNADSIDSPWVRLEIDHAQAREEETGRDFVIPVLLNDFSQEELPEFLRGRRFLSYGGGGYPRQVATFANELTDELLRLACGRPPLRCEGMAAVYFFSFVEPFLKKLYTASSLSLKHPSGEIPLKDPKRMELRILLPAVLEEFQLTQLLRSPHLGSGVLLDGNDTLFRQILFDRMIEDEPDAGVTFYDVPNILNSAAKLFDQERSNRNWERLNRMELLAFKYNLERLADKNITTKRLRAALKVELAVESGL